MIRHVAPHRRPAPRLLCAQLWRPRRTAALSDAELWLLAVALRSHEPQIHIADVASAASAAGCELSLSELGAAKTRLRRRGLCLRHGSSGDRVSLTTAGVVVKFEHEGGEAGRKDQ